MISTSLRKQDGFTIAELMIATLVFSTILIVVTVGVINFTNAYYKGVTSSSTQNTTRAAVETISQAIQLSGGTVTATAAGSPFFCAAGKVFNFSPGLAYGKSGSGIYATANASKTDCYATESSVPPFDATATQLIGKNMRVTSLSVTNVGSGGLWAVKLSLAYGDPDLLCNDKLGSAAQGGCDSGAPNYDDSSVIVDDPLKGQVRCKIQTGSQFCATSSFSTIVQQRIVAH